MFNKIKIQFPNFKITPIGIETTTETIFYYQIWKVQVKNINLNNPQIILFWKMEEIILEYSKLDIYEEHLNYILESIAED